MSDIPSPPRDESLASPEVLNPRLAELITDPEVTHVLFGCGSLLGRPGTLGHFITEISIGGEAQGRIPSMSSGTKLRDYIEREAIYGLLSGNQRVITKDGPEFEGHVAHWSDGQKDVITLTYNDRQKDHRNASHTDYHIVMSRENFATVRPIVEGEPGQVVELFRKAFPNADKSEDTLVAKSFVDLGDIAVPDPPVARQQYTQPPRRNIFGWRR